jgi:hypothetical protein
VPHHVVREEPDRASLEAGKTGDGDGLVFAQELAQRLERVSGGQALRAAVAVAEGDAAVLRGQDQARLRAEERVSRPGLAAFDGLEEKGVRTGTQAQIRRQRRVEVGGKLGEDGDEIAPACELPELLTRRRQ